MNYIHWALTGMVGYSFVTLLVKLATRHGELTSFTVLMISTVMVGIIVSAVVLYRGDLDSLVLADMTSTSALWSYAAGLALALAVTSLFIALSMGPASIVVPVYGMFIAGGAVLGILFLGESITFSKVFGIILAVASIYLITR